MISGCVCSRCLCAGMLYGSARQSLPLKYTYVASAYFDKSCVSIPPEHDRNQQNVTSAPDCCVD